MLYKNNNQHIRASPHALGAIGRILPATATKKLTNAVSHAMLNSLLLSRDQRLQSFSSSTHDLNANSLRNARAGGVLRAPGSPSSIFNLELYHLLPLLHLVVAPWWALSSLLLLVLAGG
jgi:hypothetical protein